MGEKDAPKHNGGIRLHGFNNLTKTLSFNLYDVCYACSAQELDAYLRYIDEQYNAVRLTGILRQVTGIIGARILNVAQTDFEPHGASVTLLVSEGGAAAKAVTKASCDPAPAGVAFAPEALAAHLDKSHLTVHTYPESHPSVGICTFRADIDVSTCGRISPLKALRLLLDSFESDIVFLDYRVRGFTRDTGGAKLYIDHPISSIRDYIDEDTNGRYHVVDCNMPEANIFHSRMMLREFTLDDYLFNAESNCLLPERRRQIKARLQREMQEIFEGRNL